MIRSKSARGLVSVVIPTFNQAVYLRCALESVLGQTYQQVETIVVDDGSTDSTPDILESYGHTITALRQVNRGAAAALNRGIEASHGELVCWLSSDDVFLPTKVEHQVERLMANPELGFVFTGFETMDDQGRTMQDRSNIPWIHPDLFVSVVWRNPINGSTVMLPRAVFDQVGPFDVSLRADVDGEMWLRILRRRRAAHLPGVFLRYRVHEAALSANRPLMSASKEVVRMRALQDGTLVSRVRQVDGSALRAATTLARMSADLTGQGLPAVASRLLWTSLRTGPAPAAQASAIRRLIRPAARRAGRLIGVARRGST